MLQNTYTSVVWETKTETLGRPTITITLPEGVPIPSETSTSDELMKRQYGDQESEEEPEEWIGEAIRPEPEERPTKVNTVICNTEFVTTSVETQVGLYIVNNGRPKRTLTLTITHTEVQLRDNWISRRLLIRTQVISAFAIAPAATETTTRTTKYQTYTTYFQIVTPTLSWMPYG